MKVNLDNEALEPRENVIINLLTRAELGWELDGSRQSMGFADFHLLLVRAGVELLLARSGQLCEGRVFPAKNGMGEPTRPTNSSPRTRWGIGLPSGESWNLFSRYLKPRPWCNINFIPLPCHAAELEETNIDNFSNSETTSHQIRMILRKSKIWEGKTHS